MRTFLISTITLMALSPLTSAATSSVNPTGDTFLSANNPTNNYGGAGALEVSATGLANGAYDSIMIFNLGSTKTAFDGSFGAGNWQVTGASLQLTSAAAGNPIFNANAAGTVNVTWLQNDTWTEGTGNPMAPTSDGLTYAQLSSLEGSNDQSLGAIAAPGTSSGAHTFSLTLASGLTNDILGGSTASLLLTPGDSSDSYLFNSNNFGTASSRPLLTVTAVALPEPMATSLLAAGAMLLMGRCRKR